MTAAAGVIITAGERAVRCFERLQDAGLDLNAGLLRSCFEKLVLKEDVDAVLAKLESGTVKPTAALMTTMCKEATERRFWSWALMHPDLTDDMVHTSRRMLRL